MTETTAEATGKSLLRPKEIGARRRHYEVTYMITPTVNDAEAKTINEKNSQILQSFKSNILRADDWGKKRLPHIVDKHQMARYHYFRFVGTAEALKEFERSLKLDARVLKFLTVRLSDVLSDEQISQLIERAPKEPSAAPSIRQDEEDLEGQYAAQ